MEFYKVGKTVIQLKTLFNWALNTNMSLHGNLKLISDAKPYVGLGIKYNSKESIELLRDSVYSIYIDNDYSLKTDVKLALNGIFNLVVGLNIQENQPSPYFNLIFNDNEKTPFKPLSATTNDTIPIYNSKATTATY
jgi:hypothetical protein